MNTTIGTMLISFVLLANCSILAQTNNPPQASVTNHDPSAIESTEQMRIQCIAGRRTICGKILKIFPNGILVESGYTNLLRQPTKKASWLVPGTVVASRARNFVEGKEPGAICAGMLFLTDLPPRGKPHLYDYVTIAGYPEGDYTYTSVGTLRKTVRRFSANLNKAVDWNLATAQRKTQSSN